MPVAPTGPGGPPPGVPPTYRYPRVALTRLLDDAARDFPESDAVDVLGHRLTYRELLDRADRLATVLAGHGVAPGDRVGVALGAPASLLLAAFAAWRLGAAAVLVDPDGAGLMDELAARACRVVVCADATYPRLEGLRDRLAGVQQVLVVGEGEDAAFPRNLIARLAGRRVRAGDGVSRLEDAVRRSAPEVAQAPVGREATALVVGGAALTHHEAVAAAFALRLWVPDVKAGREVLAVTAPPWSPMGIGALLGLGVLAAALVVTVPDGGAEATLARARRRRATLVAGAPSHAGALGELDALRVALVGDAVDAAEAQALHAATGARLRGGLPGPCGLVAANPVYGRAHLGAYGLALPDVTLAAVDADGAALPAGRAGALAAAGPALPGRGWWPLGVRGVVDAAGCAWPERRGDDAADPSSRAREDGAPAPRDDVAEQ